MPVIKLIVGERIVDGRRRRQGTGFAVLLTSLALGLACGFPVAAQEPAAPAQTNDATAAQVLSQLDDLVRGVDSPPAEDMAPSNDLTPTNGLTETNVSDSSGDRAGKVNRFDNSSRSQNDDRQPRGRRSQRSRSNQPGSSGSGNDYSLSSDGTQANSRTGTNNGPATLDYASFKVIVDGNIFNPNRTSRRRGEPTGHPTPKSFDSLTLVGTMTYEKGTFAFFDGTSSEYKKALKLTDSIAGYKLTNIAPNGVKLASGTNALELSVGAQLRREENGPWLLTGQSTSYAATPASTSTNALAATTAAGPDAASGGAQSDIIKKLMERREKE